MKLQILARNVQPHSEEPKLWAPGVYTVLSVQRHWTNAGLPSNPAHFPLLSGYQGNSTRKLTEGQILLQKEKGHINPLPWGVSGKRTAS